MLQQHALSSQLPEAGAGKKQKSTFKSDWSNAPGSRRSFPFSQLSAQLKANSVILLSSPAAEDEAKFYGVRCWTGGVWCLQMQAGLQAYDPAVQLVVVHQEGRFGFRSAIAEGRLLCCNRHYHLAFEHLQMDNQEGWSLEGNSLADCLLRNHKYNLTLNVRITVLAEPTGVLGNTRVISALLTPPSPESDSVATLRSTSSTSSHLEERPGENAGKVSPYLYRLLLVKPGTSNNSFNSQFTHKKDRSGVQEGKPISFAPSKPRTQVNPFLSASSGRHESHKTVPSFIKQTTVHTSPMNPDSLRNSQLHQDKSTKGQEKSHTASLHFKSSVSDWKQNIPRGDGAPFSFFASKTRNGLPDTRLDAQPPVFSSIHIPKPEFFSSNSFTPENQRRVRKWKRNLEGNEKLSRVDQLGEKDDRPSCELGRSEVSGDFESILEDGRFSSRNTSNKSTSGSGGHSPQVVIKRQFGFSAPKTDFDAPPTATPSVRGKASGTNGEEVKYSRSELEAALNKLRTDNARQEREKVIHWKLQAAVHLLKAETRQKLAIFAEMPPADRDSKAQNGDAKKNSWFSGDEYLEKRLDRWKQHLKDTTNNSSGRHKERIRTYTLKRVANRNEGKNMNEMTKIPVLSRLSAGLSQIVSSMSARYSELPYSQGNVDPA